MTKRQAPDPAERSCFRGCHSLETSSLMVKYKTALKRKCLSIFITDNWQGMSLDRVFPSMGDNCVIMANPLPELIRGRIQ